MKDTLLHMWDELNDISRRNRSIRLLKLYNKWSFDLTELDGHSEESACRSIVEKIINQSKNEILLLKPYLMMIALWPYQENSRIYLGI